MSRARDLAVSIVLLVAICAEVALDIFLFTAMQGALGAGHSALASLAIFLPAFLLALYYTGKLSVQLMCRLKGVRHA